MIPRNINKDDRPRIPPSSKDKIRGNGLNSGTGVLREFEKKVARAEGKVGIFDLLEHISENLSVSDRAAGR